MRRTVFWMLAMLGAWALPGPAHADGAVTSAYSRLDIDKGCSRTSSGEAGASFVCEGFAGYPIHFAEGDLRESVFFGHVGSWHEDAWESFTGFNSVNDTVEWRLRDGVPFAAILRWFIEHPDPDTGDFDAARRRQVLVVSRVAQPEDGDGCVVGYVDALANGDANSLAREVADRLAEDFTCREDEPRFHGERGPGILPTRTFAQ